MSDLRHSLGRYPPWYGWGVASLVARILLERIEAEKRRREERTKKVREAIASAFEATEGPAYCVRRLEVVEHVARSLGEAVLNNAFHAEVERAARWLGMQPVRNGNRSLFRCAKRRDQDEEAARASSRENRRDPRHSRVVDFASAAGEHPLA
jgi:hypothetical protein